MADKPPPPTPRSSQAVPPPRSGGPTRPEVERALALRDVMDHAVRVHREITDPKPLNRRRARSIWTGILCVLLIALCVYSWFARPEFIWGPSARSVAPQRRDANVRFAMFLLAQRVRAYRKTNGSLPTSLAAMGESMPGVSLRVVSDSVFELTASEKGRAVVYRSNASINAFLGEAPKYISGNTP